MAFSVWIVLLLVYKLFDRILGLKINNAFWDNSILYGFLKIVKTFWFFSSSPFSEIASLTKRDDYIKPLTSNNTFNKRQLLPFSNLCLALYSTQNYHNNWLLCFYDIKFILSLVFYYTMSFMIGNIAHNFKSNNQYHTLIYLKVLIFLR